MHLHKGPDKGHTSDRIEKRKKAQHPAGFEPMTSLSWGVRSTPVLQPLPKNNTT